MPIPSRATELHLAPPPQPHAGARLVHEGTGQSFDVAAAGLTIGRDTSCDVVLTAAGVSRRHATVEWQGGDLVLRDASANGLAVSGARVRGTWRLRHGDRIEIEGEALRLEWERPQASAAAATVYSPALQATALMPGVEAPAQGVSSAARAPSAPLATLELRTGPGAGRLLPIAGPVCAIGRSEGSDVRLTGHSVSASHATLMRKGGQWFVVDLASSNGTFVDGYRVAGERELPNGCTLRVGDVELTFRSTFQAERDGGGTRHIVGLLERFAKLW